MAFAKTIQKSFDKEREKVERWTKHKREKGEGKREREKRAKGREKHQHKLREALIYRDAGTLRLRLTANLRVNSLGDKLAELRRKYSWHYAYA